MMQKDDIDISPKNLFDLPKEIIDFIFTFLDVQTLCRLAQVSKNTKSHSENDQIWLRHFNLLMTDHCHLKKIFLTEEPKDKYKNYFKNYYTLFKRVNYKPESDHVNMKGYSADNMRVSHEVFDLDGAYSCQLHENREEGTLNIIALLQPKFESLTLIFNLYRHDYFLYLSRSSSIGIDFRYQTREDFKKKFKSNLADIVHPNIIYVKADIAKLKSYQITLVKTDIEKVALSWQNQFKNSINADFFDFAESVLNVISSNEDWRHDFDESKKLSSNPGCQIS